MRTLESILSSDFDITDDDLILIGNNYYIIPKVLLHSNGLKQLRKYFREFPPKTPPHHDPLNRLRNVEGVIVDWVYCQTINDLPAQLPSLFWDWWEECPVVITVKKALAAGHWEIWVDYGQEMSTVMIIKLKPKKK